MWWQRGPGEERPRVQPTLQSSEERLHLRLKPSLAHSTSHTHMSREGPAEAEGLSDAAQEC